LTPPSTDNPPIIGQAIGQLVGSNIQSVGSNQGRLAAKERKGRKEQALYFYVFSAFFLG
jgi:hypothetical protein